MKFKKEKTEEAGSTNKFEKNEMMPDSSDTDMNQEGNETASDKGREEGTADIRENETEEIDYSVLKAELEEKSQKCNEYFAALQRAAAEFDNYKKRTAREKEALYTDAVCDVAAAFLPVLDNMERAIAACSNAYEAGSLKEGVEMVYRQMKDVLKNLGIEEIKSLNEAFDPNVHNAVMHVDDENAGQGVVVEEFQKGYKYKDKVIRHSMVKVAN